MTGACYSDGLRPLFLPVTPCKTAAELLQRWGPIEESTKNMRSIQLSTYRYAAEWPIDNIQTPAEMTELGTEFVDLPEGPEKEEKLVAVLRGFHGYLLKYMKMILLGRLPLQRSGRGARDVNKDTHLLFALFYSARPGWPTGRRSAPPAGRCIWLLRGWMPMKSMTSS